MPIPAKKFGAIFENHTARAALIILLLVAAVFVVRMLTPDDLRNRDQVKVCAYILDAAYNGQWICQVDGSGSVTSKPPLYNWLGALMVLLFGANRSAYALPAFFGTLLATWAVWGWTRDLTRDERSAWLAVLCYLATNAVIKQTALVRTDGLFTGLSALCAWQVWRAWETDRGWWRAWLLAAFATVTKGPFAILLGFGGLAAVFLNRRSPFRKDLPAGWWHGVILPVLFGVIWMTLAWLAMGQAFYEKVLVAELWGHAAGGVADPDNLFAAIRPPLYLVSRAFPWSPLLVWALWRIFRQPAADPAQRRGERYLAIHLAVGLLALMIASHKRADLVFPLLPAAAVLEGRMLATWSRAWHWPKMRTGIAVFTVLFALLETWYLAVPRARNDAVALGLENKAFADSIERDCGRFFPFSFASSQALQYRLRVTRPAISADRAARLLAGKEAVFIVTENLPALLSRLPKDTPCQLVYEEKGRSCAVVSNRAELVPEPDMAVVSNFWEVYGKGIVIRRMRGSTAWIDPAVPGKLVLKNTGRRACRLKLVLPDGRRHKLRAPAGATVTLTTADLGIDTR